jgi:16S rRNA (guanine527-N7)-methyltransferase
VQDIPAERAAELIDALGRALGRDVPEQVRVSLCDYAALVAKWNRTINLTGAHEPTTLAEVLFADAFVLADPEIVPVGARVLDVGSGAGAPIVPLLLLRADLSALCVEPLGKRATFLRMLSGRLPLLPRLRVREARLDPDDPGQLGEAFDVAGSRATFEPERWLALGLALAPRVLVMVASAPPPEAPPGARLLRASEYCLPFSGAPRRACVYLRE